MNLERKTSIKFDKNLGKVFKNLRKSKSFSQVEASEGVISVTQLSNFENGKTMPAADKFITLLKNINVTLLEFENSYNQFLCDQDILLYDTKISSAYLTHDINQLKAISKKIDYEMKLVPNRKKYLLDKCHVEALISSIDPNYQFSSENIQILKDYLLGLKDWGLYDIFLFGHCIKAFNEVTFDLLIDRLLLGTQETVNLHTVNHSFIQTLLNVVDVCLSKKRFLQARLLINHLKHMRIHEYYLYEKLTLIYSDAKYQLQRGQQSALETMKQCQDIFLFCDCPNTAHLIKEEIEKLES